MCDDTTSLKRCPKCGENYPATREHFYANKRTPTGLENWCKSCMRQKSADYRANNPEKWAQTLKRYTDNHPEEIAATQKKYRLKNIDKLRAKAREYYKSGGIEVAERRKASGQKYDQSHRPQLRLRAKLRRIRKKGRLAAFSCADWQRALEYWDNRCCICGKQADFWTTLARGHWIPDCVGGEFTPANIVPMCHAKPGTPVSLKTPCNNSIHKLFAEDWVKQTYSKAEAKRIIARVHAYFEWVREQATVNCEIRGKDYEVKGDLADYSDDLFSAE